MRNPSHTGNIDTDPFSENERQECLNMKALPLVASICLTLVAGCAVDKYQTVTPSFLGAPAAHDTAEAVVLLQPVFPGKPISEIVCDNVIGVSWSPEESRHIGFTQHYASSITKNSPQLIMLAALPANQRIGMSASGNLQPLNIDSRILVPFGRYIVDNLKQAAGPNGEVCEDMECVRQAMQRRPGRPFVSVHFAKFRVAEGQRNMLLLEIEGTATIRRANEVEMTVPIHKLVDRSIASEGMWHSDFLRTMNKIANESTSAVAEQIRAASRQLSAGGSAVSRTN
jgi:hypothetical protein